MRRRLRARAVAAQDGPSVNNTTADPVLSVPWQVWLIFLSLFLLLLWLAWPRKLRARKEPKA